jgi:NAD kinase
MTATAALRPKLAFLFNPAVPDFKRLGEALHAQYDGVAHDVADILVPIGGDGSVLYALPLAKGRTVYGLVPAESSSIAYTANGHAHTDDLHDMIATAEKTPVYPLDVLITYADGTSERRNVFSSLSIERDAGQAALMDLTGHFNGASQTIRVMGDGVAFHTPMGSTGMGYSHGGPIVSPARPAIIFTGMGLGRPRGLNPIVAGEGEGFSVDCIVSKGKRPLRLDMDGNTLRPSMENPVARVDVYISNQPAAQLAVKKGSFHPFKRMALD